MFTIGSSVQAHDPERQFDRRTSERGETSSRPVTGCTRRQMSTEGMGFKSGCSRPDRIRSSRDHGQGDCHLLRCAWGASSGITAAARLPELYEDAEGVIARGQTVASVLINRGKDNLHAWEVSQDVRRVREIFSQHQHSLALPVTEFFGASFKIFSQ